jgi:hypothetical protein
MPVFIIILYIAELGDCYINASKFFSWSIGTRGGASLMYCLFLSPVINLVVGTLLIRKINK